MSINKAELHRLIDALPEQETKTVKRFLEFIIKEHNPWQEVLSKQTEVNEPLNEDDKLAIQEAEQDVKAGMVKSWDQVKKELGL
ncbi:hypothetical protein JCM14036_02710 [Desulfotomaculum defluvii]